MHTAIPINAIINNADPDKPSIFPIIVASAKHEK